MLSINELESWLSNALEKELYWVGVCIILGIGSLWNGWAVYEALTSLTMPLPIERPVQEPIPQWRTALFGLYATHGEIIAMAHLEEAIVGLLFSENPKQSQVILRAENGFDKIYHEGDILKSGITIYAIRPTGIILSNHGEFEKLEMVKTEIHFDEVPEPLPLKDAS